MVMTVRGSNKVEKNPTRTLRKLDIKHVGKFNSNGSHKMKKVKN